MVLSRRGSTPLSRTLPPVMEMLDSPPELAP